MSEKIYTIEEIKKILEELLVDATVFAISPIGELVKNISKETMEENPNIEWIIIKKFKK